MTESSTTRELGKVAQKWRELAEKRRAYFTDLYRSGRWRLYYTDDELLLRMREVVAAAERWGAIAPRESEPAPGQAEITPPSIQRAA